MKIILILLLLFTLGCSTNKVRKNHGVLSLDNKYKKLFINKTNSNDLIEILGPPSTKSDFDKNTWIYIERTKENQSLLKIGKQKIKKNNVLVVTLNDKGVLEKKELLDIDNMNKVKFSEERTETIYSKNSYIYNVFTSLREKINAPVRKKLNEKKN